MDEVVCPSAWWEALGHAAHVELEVGCGRGIFLLEEARRRPDCGFLGIEVSAKWANRASRALAEAGIRNALVVRAEAVEFMRAHVEAESIDAVHVYFPDPWPRPRHQKRRIWRPEFLHEVLRILRPDGRIMIATDIRGYFEGIQAMLSSQVSLQQRPFTEARPLTTYARKFLERGRPVFATTFVKREGSVRREHHDA